MDNDDPRTEPRDLNEGGVSVAYKAMEEQIRESLEEVKARVREALASLVSSKLSWLGEDQRISLRETSDQLIRHLEDLDAIRERAAVTQEEVQSRLAEQQNVRMYVLSIVVAILR